MGTDSVMGAPEGLLSVFFITGFLLGTCLNEETCVGDACFNEGVLQLKIDRSRTDTKSGLKYKEGKSVVKENALLATFGGIKGGEDAVRECLQIPEVYEYEYYEYDYADYYEEYDYLEESGSRQRRAAASNGEKDAKKARKGAKKAKQEAKKAKKDARKRKRKNKKQNRQNKRGGKGQMKKGGRGNKNKKCKEGKNSKKCKNNRKRQNRKQEKEADKKAERRAAKKAARQEEKEASKSDKDNQKKALTKL